MDDNPLSDIDEDKVDHLVPEGATPPGAMDFSAEAQQAKFLSGVSSNREPVPLSTQRDKENITQQGEQVSMYNPDNQIKLKGTENYLDVVNTERTRAAREIQAVSGIPVLANGGEGLEWAIRNTNREVGQRFRAHGVAKYPVEDLDRLITQGLSQDRTFYSMPFVEERKAGEAFGADMPKTEGGIIVLADYDTQFPTEGNPQIRYILLDEQYMQAADIMRQRYEKFGVEVVPWHDVPKILTENVNSHNPGQEKYSFNSVNPQSPVRYPQKRVGPAKLPETKIPVPEAKKGAGDVW